MSGTLGEGNYLMTTLTTDLKKQKSLLSLIILGLGFFGIQYAWAVQYSQMSTFLEKFGDIREND